MKNNQTGAGSWLKHALGLSDGDSPFPWQTSLLEKLCEGCMPRALDIPTGLGKTSVMAAWLVARACGANLPRRLVYVVDRRAVVDQATTEAEKLQRWVYAQQDVKDALGLERSLPISTLRGQFADNREWLGDPASPAIIVGTVDMVGSRLLFEGYGASRKMRPYHAGLLGADTLLVLDEAHLVPPFEKLIEAVADGTDEFGPSDQRLRALIPPFRFMSLSATGRSVPGNSHGLTNEDFKHPILKKRLEARKRLLVKPLASSGDGPQPTEEEGTRKRQKADLAKALAREAWQLMEKGTNTARIIVFCDSRDVAVAAKAAVEAIAEGDKKQGLPTVAIERPELFVGGRRVFEREQARHLLEKLGFLAGSKVQCEKPTFLFATSAAEVGVDLDADHMVCDLVAWERMVQRLGRVNRRGEGEATIVVIVEPEPTPDKREQEALDKQKRGAELKDKEQERIDAFTARVRKWKAYQAPFDQLPKDEDGARDASPGSLRKLKRNAGGDQALRTILDAATTPAPLRPALTRALVDAWSLTSIEAHTGRPAVGPWLRGWVDEDPQTTIVWRKYLPVRSGLSAPTRKDIEDFFEAAPPHLSEMLETETNRVLDWIKKRVSSTLKRTTESGTDNGENKEPSLLRKEDVVAFVLGPDGRLRRSLRLEELATVVDGEDERTKEELKKALFGSPLVVDARLAGLKDGLLDSAHDAPPATADDDTIAWLTPGAVGFRVRAASAEEVSPSADDNWRERFRFADAVSEEGEVLHWLIVDKWLEDAATEEDRSVSLPQLLDEHQSWTERRARKLARRLGLQAEYEEMLAAAARFHDEGKQARDWQRAFNAPRDGIYAKTKGPINYRLLDGYRHEFGSLPYAERDERLQKLDVDLRELALDLIASHHGFARPVIGTNGCEDAPPSALAVRAREVALRFARLQKRWGPWGLAWWQALLRAADQQASRDNDRQGRLPQGGA